MTDKLKAIIHGITGESPRALIELLGEEIRSTLFQNPEDYFSLTRESLHQDDLVGQDIVGSVYEVELTVRKMSTIATKAGTGGLDSNDGDDSEEYY